MTEVKAFLLARAQSCRAAGMAPERISLDPGFGLGKNLQHNAALPRGLDAFADTGYPLGSGFVLQVDAAEDSWPPGW